MALIIKEGDVSTEIPGDYDLGDLTMIRVKEEDNSTPIVVWEKETTPVVPEPPKGLLKSAVEFENFESTVLVIALPVNSDFILLGGRDYLFYPQNNNVLNGAIISNGEKTIIDFKKLYEEFPECVNIPFFVVSSSSDFSSMVNIYDGDTVMEQFAFDLSNGSGYDACYLGHYENDGHGNWQWVTEKMLMTADEVSAAIGAAGGEEF